MYCDGVAFMFTYSFYPFFPPSFCNELLDEPNLDGQNQNAA